MTDVENVIYAIERCTCHVPDSCRDCPYDAGHPYNECIEMLLKDAMELLKEQEHKTGYWENGHCTCCGEDIASKLDTWTNVQTFSFCPKCGAKMEVKCDD